MRITKSLVMGFIVTVAGSVSISSAQAASPECPLAGQLSAWGANSTGAFVVPSGGGCLFPVRMDGVINSSSIKQKPAHGTLKKLNVSTYEYLTKAGYKGPDSFSVQFTGKGPTSSGTSVITMQATVQ